MRADVAPESLELEVAGGVEGCDDRSEYAVECNH
jgi:hypothetical protein